MVNLTGNKTKAIALAWTLSLFSLTSKTARAQDEESIDTGAPSTCHKVYESSMQHYRALAKFLPKTYQLRDQLPTHQLLKIAGDGCDRLETLDLFQKVASLHTQRIAVLLPLSRWSEATQRSMINQLKSYVATQGLDPQKQLVILDTGGQILTLQQQLAQLVFTQHVSVVIGGLTQAEAPVLSQWASRLRIPTIILNRKLAPPRNRYVFRVGPDQKEMANSLLAHIESKGFKRVALMMPQSSRDGTLADALHASSKVEIVGPLVYNPNDFGSIDLVFKRLFHLNDDARKQEMLDLITELKDKAKSEGVAFDPRGLMLPPQVDVDALVILDHFKNVRHLAKSLHYYGVQGLPLLGIPKWRAPEIVDQEETNLKNAVFVDYVGSYQQLPYGISANTIVNELFVEGKSASRVDLELAVTHAVAAALPAVKGTRVPRYTLFKRMEQAIPDEKNFFGTQPFFKADHEGNWPTFMFAIQNGKLAAIGRNLGRRVPESKSKVKPL